MAPDRQRIQQYLKAFDFRTLFIEELGWDTLREAPLAISVDGQSYTLRPLVEKRGFKVYTCSPDAKGQVPSSAIMHKIEREVTRHAYEHIIIYIDAAQENQAWQWIKREPGKASASRLYRLHSNQSGELLSQKLLALAFSIEEEAQLGTTVVAARVRQALDVERVTKKFYDRFQKEHASFLTFIEGISAQADCEWYASLMLNRLMFVYFIQKKGLLATSGHGQLDGDHDYLSHKLNIMQARYGSDQFYSFYRYFLLRLFHEGLSSRERSPDLDQLLGNVPYLNGGLFDMHVLERDYPAIQITDEAFARIFAFFDEYQWHLDDRPLHNDREINPDVLGYIFEKYINQKQMGAYYTKEDITEYIGKNTIIPSLLESAEQKCLIAFAPDGPTWALLRDDPDRYIYEAVKKGCELPLPEEIEVGIDDVSQRGEWNKAAPSEYALPTEIWREVVARRVRYEEVRMKLANGEISAINDLITYSEGVDLLNAFYESLEHVTILDPTCGSGAFLFAALTILEPLYEACLDRMQEMVAERDRLDAAFCMAGASPATTIHDRDAQPLYSSGDPCGRHVRFREVLAKVARHPNRRYFILKSIIINNLYGVDIIEEASEICKLRLFLKLVAQIERFEDIEPLPDIDFNIRAGNTLVGFASYEETKRAIEGKTVGKGTTRDEAAFQDQMIFDDRLDRIEQKAQEVERSFEHFRSMQTVMNIDAELMAEVKEQVRSQLKELSAELDGYLASEYGIDRNSIPKKEEYEERFTQWRLSHQPFHWFVEFYGIMKKGGFDVIIGNPPYVEISDIAGQYSLRGLSLAQTGNLYSVCVERFIALLAQSGRTGVIVPISSISTPRMLPLMQLLNKQLVLYISNFAVRPGKLFVGVDMNLTILIGIKKLSEVAGASFSTSYNRWNEENRISLFKTLSYSTTKLIDSARAYSKLGSQVALSIESKIAPYDTITRLQSGAQLVPVYYHSGGRYFRKCIRKKLSNEYKELKIIQGAEDVIICLLSSSFYYWLWISSSDCYHVTKGDIEMLPIPDSLLKDTRLKRLANALLSDLEKHSQVRIRNRADGSQREEVNYYVGKSKPIIDEIDRVLARHYGFTDEELDFIINYDIKYRMGRGDGDVGEDEE